MRNFIWAIVMVGMTGSAIASDAKPAAHGAEAKPAAHGAEAKPAKPAAHGAEAKPAEAKHAESKTATAKPSPAPKAAEHVAPKPVVKAAATRPPLRAPSKPKPAIRTHTSVSVNGDDRSSSNAPPLIGNTGGYPAGSYVLMPAAQFMAAQGVVPIQLMAQAAHPVAVAQDAHAATAPVRTTPAVDAHSAPHVAKRAVPPVVSANEALEELKKGNTHHVKGRYKHENTNRNRLLEVAKGQKPHAIILSCSDSRVPPEIVFDKGLGDLFVIRVAGNVADTAELASIEYAAEHLNVPLVVVMGHKRCGAITAATGSGDPGGHITELVRQIKPSVERARNMPGDLVDNGVHTNIEDVVKNLRRSQPILNQMVEAGTLRIVGAYYDLDTGKVDWLY